MNHNLDHLLNLCLEIEGLIALANRREDNTPDQVFNLLREKSAHLQQGINNLNAGTVFATDDTEDSSLIAEAMTYEEQKDAVGIDCDSDCATDTTTPEISDNDHEASIGNDDSIIADTLCDNDVSRIADRPAEFSINDKFRFRRELFGNSDVELNEALNVINAMSSIAEIEDYFYNDLCWDPENEDVKDFIRIVSARFNNAD